MKHLRLTITIHDLGAHRACRFRLRPSTTSELQRKDELQADGPASKGVPGQAGVTGDCENGDRECRVEQETNTPTA
jgi:hypothetical protein